MATTKNKKIEIKFNKFFPGEDSFVYLKGVCNPNSESKFDYLDIDLTIQSSLRSSVVYSTWLGDVDSTLAQFKAIKEASEKAIAFIEANKDNYKKAKPIVKDKVIKGMKK